MSTNNSSLPNKLRELRLLHGYTQKDIGDYLNITRQGYAHYEKGGRTPDNQTLLQLASLYSIDISQLINNNLIPITVHEDPLYPSTPKDSTDDSIGKTIPSSLRQSNHEKTLLNIFRQLPSDIQNDVIEFAKFRLYQNKKQ
jgi:transcriptional regulator with XRE-family HTH domain